MKQININKIINNMMMITSDFLENAVADYEGLVVFMDEDEKNYHVESTLDNILAFNNKLKSTNNLHEQLYYMNALFLSNDWQELFVSGDLVDQLVDYLVNNNIDPLHSKEIASNFVNYIDKYNGHDNSIEVFINSAKLNFLD